MPEVTIPQGETRKLIEADQADQDYTFRVSGGPVRMAHSERYAREGQEYSKDDRGILTRLNGQALYAYASGAADATVQLDSANFTADLHPRDKVANISDIDNVNAVGEIQDVTTTVVTNPTDDQTREIGKIRTQDSGGTLIDPREQEAYASEYTTIDLNATGATAVYQPTNDATVTGVYMENTGGTATVRLEVTDGNNAAVLADPSAGGDLTFDGEIRLSGGTDYLQIVVEAAEGSALTGTAAVSRGEL